MGDWYSVKVYQAHQGQGNEHLITVYMHLDRVTDAFGRCKRMAGISRHRGVHSLEKLSAEDAVDLERRIERERRVQLKDAKREWYYPKESRNIGRRWYSD